jgi:hypothetical protein
MGFVPSKPDETNVINVVVIIIFVVVVFFRRVGDENRIHFGFIYRERCSMLHGADHLPGW